MISKINLAKTLGIKHRLDLNLDSKPQHKSIVLKLIRTNTDQSLMSKINAAKTLGIKHRLDLDLDSKPQHRSIESRASSFSQKKNPEHHGFTTTTVLPQEQQASNYATLMTTRKGKDEHRLIHVPMYDQSKRLNRLTSSSSSSFLASSSASVAAAAGAASTTATAHVILGQERGDWGQEHGGPLLGSHDGLRA